MIHNPVMVAEVLAALRPNAGGRFVDGTIGLGGHAAAILEASSPTGRLYGCDRDGDAVSMASERLASFKGRYEIQQGSFADLGLWIEPRSCDAILLDLGVSSRQLDEPNRGFSFQADGPLDMRMDRRQSLTAAQLIREMDEKELARIFWELGEEREARRLANWIVKERQIRPIESTRHLASLVERVKSGGKRRIHPATKVFQAVRMAVNDELGSLRQGLEAVWKLLKPGGRLAIITFHSGEDRVVKEFGRRREKDYVVPGEIDVPELRIPRPAELRWVSRKAIKPSLAEVAANPRARSAQLRVLEKIYGP